MGVVRLRGAMRVVRVVRIACGELCVHDAAAFSAWCIVFVLVVRFVVVRCVVRACCGGACGACVLRGACGEQCGARY